MARTSDKRERLLVAARTLIHTQGFNQTTLSDIAQTSGVPLGNVYYYFKTKDDLGAAVIAEHTAELRVRFEAWSHLPTPRERLHRLIDYMDERREVLAQHGCPIGSLCQELDKDLHTATSGGLTYEANSVLGIMLDWAVTQFREWGDRAVASKPANGTGETDKAEDSAEALGEQFIAQLQGIILLANARQDPQLVARQAHRLRIWLDSHPA